MALAAPAGSCDPGRLAQGTALLESWGLRVRGLPELRAKRYMAADDAVRGRSLRELFEDPEVRAVLCARGGYGCARLDSSFPLAAVAANPKVLVGFSDVSLLLTRVLQEADLVCYHGPMAAADLPRIGAEAQERFRRFLFAEEGWWDGSFSECWREGRASGTLVGGCLSVLVTTLGTPYELDTRGRVLFLEDVAEKPYRIDRMLTQLRHAGKFDEVAAVVFGPMLDCDDGEGTEVLREAALELINGRDCPVVFGLDAGHGSSNVVLPLGCRVSMDSASGCLELLEPVFALED